MTLFHSDPVGLPGLAALALGFALFLLSLLVARAGRDPADSAGGRRSPASAIGIAVQALGISVAGLGPVLTTLDPLAPAALVEGAVVLLLMLAMVGLFVASTRTMGRNWSIVARTRANHELVATGPFAYIRHPIYAALFLLLPAIAIAFGHSRQLVLAVPLYALGTWLRIGHEERLLHERFGDDYTAYAARVRRFVPGVF